MAASRQGPLAGVRVLELGGIGPGPFAGMMLSDMGAEVIRLDRPGAPAQGVLGGERNLLLRGRRSVALDLHRPEALAAALKLVAAVDVLVEGFRPGVAERLGVGPGPCLERNPRLVYARVTGWGQAGPLAQAAGHDIDYVALTGVLNAIGERGGPPLPPLNLVGDYGGGGMLLAFGIACALLEARSSGRGQVVDAAMIDGAALLSTFLHAATAAGLWRQQRGANLLDGGAPFYSVYETADGRHVAVGALEPRFYEELLRRLGLEPETMPLQMDRAGWPETRRRLAAAFRTRSRDEWSALLEGTDACVAPVLALGEAPAHRHHRARGTYVEEGGTVQPAPAPRFSRTPGAIQGAPPRLGADTAAVLGELGYGEAAIGHLLPPAERAGAPSGRG